MKRKFQFRVGGGNMIKYLMDISVPEDCKCAKCCIYCEEKDTYEYKCQELTNEKTEKRN